MSRKIRVGILFGGRSAEHEVSLQSAKNIIEAIDKEKYEPVLIGIDKDGHWYLNENSKFLLNEDNPRLIKLNNANRSVALIPGRRMEQLVNLSDKNPMDPIDVIFPVLHGPFGEDGTVQGLLKLANIPFVGAGVLGSAIGMDKDVMKRLLRDAGIPVAKFITFRRSEAVKINFMEIIGYLGLPFFIKPANLGSSIGISKVNDETQFKSALKEAFKYDNKIIIEEYVDGREIECSVLGNDEPIASVPGEIVTTHDFYSYEAKYIDENGATLHIPADLPSDIVKEVQDIAIKAFKVLCCEGMARVDFFLRDGLQVIVNEINTIPGFTRISMYPKLWEASGIPYSVLIDKLIQLAIERFKNEQMILTSYKMEDELK